jgi:hypothetical protein
MATTVTSPLLHLLGELRSIIQHIDAESYAAPAPGRGSGGIGGHVRHCLDHVQTLLSATRSRFCAYDRRTRGTDVERCPLSAVRQIAELEAKVANLGPDILELPIAVETQSDTRGTMVVTTSTVAREIVFVTSHMVHHNALMGSLLAAQGIDMGARFGVAPATPSPREQLACAR